MKSYTDLKTAKKSLNYQQIYKIAQAKDKAEKKALRSNLRELFEDGATPSAELLTDLKKANFFKENENIFKEKYSAFAKENPVLFK